MDFQCQDQLAENNLYKLIFLDYKRKSLLIGWPHFLMDSTDSLLFVPDHQNKNCGKMRQQIKERQDKERKDEVLQLAQDQLRSDLSWVIITEKINSQAHFSKQQISLYVFVFPDE